MIHALLRYACKIFLTITHQTTLREAQPNTAPVFSDVAFRKRILGNQLFVPRPYFICYLTVKRFVKDPVAGSSIYCSKKVVNFSKKLEITHVYCEF